MKGLHQIKITITYYAYVRIDMIMYTYLLICAYIILRMCKLDRVRYEYCIRGDVIDICYGISIYIGDEDCYRVRERDIYIYIYIYMSICINYIL